MYFWFFFFMIFVLARARILITIKLMTKGDQQSERSDVDCPSVDKVRDSVLNEFVFYVRHFYVRSLKAETWSTFLLIGKGGKLDFTNGRKMWRNKVFLIKNNKKLNIKASFLFRLSPLLSCVTLLFAFQVENKFLVHVLICYHLNLSLLFFCFCFAVSLSADTCCKLSAVTVAAVKWSDKITRPDARKMKWANAEREHFIIKRKISDSLRRVQWTKLSKTSSFTETRDFRMHLTFNDDIASDTIKADFTFAVHPSTAGWA